MCKVTMNEEKNGIEIRFDEKPDKAVLEMLKDGGFRWSQKQKMWYAKKNDERMSLVANLDSVSVETKAEKVNTQDNAYDLFEMTRTDTIGNNVDKNLSAKEIAAIIRKHMRRRFPFCKFSVTTDRSGYFASIDLDILSTPFAKGSEEFEAIREYFNKYTASYNYCEGRDLYSDDLGTTNFYGGHCSGCYRYVQGDFTEEMKQMSERFMASKLAHKISEDERMKREYEMRMAQKEEERREDERREEIRRANRDLVESGAVVKNLDTPYFLENVIELRCSKNNTLDEYESEHAENPGSRVACQVTREVHLCADLYKLFSSQLLDDWSFISGTGGSRTEDMRISSFLDYEMMTKDVQDTVHWFSRNCVAIFCEGKLMCVVDAQGYTYCRYVFLVDGATYMADSHETKQAITKEEYEAYAQQADRLEDASAEIILENHWEEAGNKWNVERFEEYKQAMIAWIEHNKFPMSVHVVRAIPSSVGDEFKTAMYRILQFTQGIRYQMAKADIHPGQKITIVKMDEWLGGVRPIRCTFEDYVECRYAQHEDNVRVTFKQERKHNLSAMHIHGDVLIYDGYIPDIPEELMWDVKVRPNGVVTKLSRFMSFDHKQYDVIMEHYKKLGCNLLVNTINNEFADKEE